MRGHEGVIAMRRKGSRPAHVTLQIGDGPADSWPSVPELHPYPVVMVHPVDVPELLDLRFVVGLPVIVDGGESVERMRRLMLAAEDAGAVPVYGFASRPMPGGRFEPLAAACTQGEDQLWRI